MTASTASAAKTPWPAERQSLRPVPAANTIVTASTASTAQARNTAMNSPQPCMHLSCSRDPIDSSSLIAGSGRQRAVPGC